MKAIMVLFGLLFAATALADNPPLRSKCVSTCQTICPTVTDITETNCHNNCMNHFKGRSANSNYVNDASQTEQAQCQTVGSKSGVTQSDRIDKENAIAKDRIFPGEGASSTTEP